MYDIQGGEGSQVRVLRHKEGRGGEGRRGVLGLSPNGNNLPYYK